MKILSGLFEHMVLQRSGRGRSDAPVRGEADGNGVLHARVVTGSGRPVPGFSGVRIGAVRRGRFKGVIRGLPAGGPYGVELRVDDAAGRVVDSLAVHDVRALRRRTRITCAFAASYLEPVSRHEGGA